MLQSQSYCVITYLNDSSAYFNVKFSSKANQYVFCVTLGQKLSVWIFVHWFYILNKMNVLCTLAMFHLSTCDHNLYTFAQSTQCLYINSYFMSHLIFLYMFICQMLQDNMKRMTLIIQMTQCVSIWVSVMTLLLFFFQCERNKSPCRNSKCINVYINSTMN